jgi:hypothetical protein
MGLTTDDLILYFRPGEGKGNAVTPERMDAGLALAIELGLGPPSYPLLYRLLKPLLPNTLLQPIKALLCSRYSFCR